MHSYIRLSAHSAVFTPLVCVKALLVSLAHGSARQLIRQKEQQGVMKGGFVFFQGVVHPDTSTPVLQPAASLQVCQMAGDGRLRHVESNHQVADAEFIAPLEQNKKAQSGFVGEGFKEGSQWFHGGQHSEAVIMCQSFSISA